MGTSSIIKKPSYGGLFFFYIIFVNQSTYQYFYSFGQRIALSVDVVSDCRLTYARRFINLRECGTIPITNKRVIRTKEGIKFADFVGSDILLRILDIVGAGVAVDECIFDL